MSKNVNENEGNLYVNTCTFTGHRPNKLYGYSLDSPRYQMLAQELAKHLRGLIQKEGVKRFISGGAIGFDTVAFFTVEQMKREFDGIENILAVPFENQFIKWRAEDKERYHRMKSQADKVIYVDTLDEYKTKNDNTPVGEYSNPKMQRRNEYMVNNSNYIVALWDGTSGGTGNCVKYVLKQSNYSQIAIMNPHSFEIKFENC